MAYKIQITRNKIGKKPVSFTGKKKYETLIDARAGIKKAKKAVAEDWQRFKKKQIKQHGESAFRKAKLKENFGYSYKPVKVG